MKRSGWEREGVERGRRGTEREETEREKERERGRERERERVTEKNSSTCLNKFMLLRPAVAGI